MRNIGWIIGVALAAAIFQPVHAQLPPPTGPSFGGSVPGSEKVVAGIAWYGILQDGMELATTNCLYKILLHLL